MRTSALVGGAIAVIMFASACSGGSGKVSVGPKPTHPAGNDSTSTSESRTRKPASTAGRKKHAKKSGATSTTRGRAAAGTTNGGTIYVPLGDTTTSVYTPSTSGQTPTTAGHTPTTVNGPKPYDPSKPIDLSGTPGVTPAELARAEQLVRDTLRDLPHFADPNIAYAEGYRTIHDEITGDEHYINWSYLSDGRVLDTKHPESLVYEKRNGKRTLVAAMFTLELGQTFADVPDIGGPLTQWHIHNDLCLYDLGNGEKQVIIKINGVCPGSSQPVGITPMIHVWIVKNACGPFASLEGIGAGQVPPGQTRNCDKAHGSR